MTDKRLGSLEPKEFKKLNEILIGGLRLVVHLRQAEAA